jgi:hypothetical protein
MQITIEGKISADPKDRILAIEAATKSICEMVGQDQADGVMMLLTAAAHITMQNIKPGMRIEPVMAEALGAAIVAAEQFFRLREVK